MIIMRIYRYEKYKKVFDSEVTKEFFSIILTVCAMIIFFACMLQVIIQYNDIFMLQDGTFNIHDWSMNERLDQYIYFVIIAISTVGYGNPYRTD